MIHSDVKSLRMGITLCFFLIPFLVGVLLLPDQLLTSYQINRASIDLLNGNKTEAITRLVRIASTHCQVNWLLGRVLTEGNHRAVLLNYLICDPASIELLKGAMPLDLTYAQIAVEVYPDNSQAWFWLAEILDNSDKSAALSFYLTSVALNPTDGFAWCRIGFLSSRPEDALNAFLNCCYFGDPGVNGCAGAGRIVEFLGDPQKAIEYYRLSHWEVALKRADELEAELNSGN